MFYILINALYLSSVLSLDTVNTQNGVHLKRQTSNTAPSFATTEYKASVPEHQDPGYHVILITAADPDQGENGKLTYSMTAIRDSRSNDMFTINPISGQVTTTKQLDRKTIPRHDFQVTATDNNVLFKKSAVTTLAITVEDENDHNLTFTDINKDAPIFDQSSYKIEIHESLPVASVIGNVRAIDRDSGSNGRIKYSITEPASQTTFQIDAFTGSISTTKILDREVQASYQLVIEAKDQAMFGQQLSSTASVNITILDDNDNAPMFTQGFYNTCVNESSNISTLVYRVFATDLDEGLNRAISYSITGGNTDSAFRINSTSGELFTHLSLDNKIRSYYSLQIKASDNGKYIRLSSTTTLKIYVLPDNVNYSLPYFLTQNKFAAVREMVPVGSLVTTIEAVDPDQGCNSNLKYSLLNASTLPFTIDADTGGIFVTKLLDREMQDRYTLEIQAASYWMHSLISKAVITIHILDVNDNAPMLSERRFDMNITDATPIGHRIVQLSATDQDINDNLSYRIRNGNEENFFEIQSETGVVTLKKSLVSASNYRFTLTVEVSDGMYYDVTTIFVNVVHTLLFVKDSYTFSIFENEAIGTILGKVEAVNSLYGNNTVILYELQNTNAFSIDKMTGEIKTKRLFDRESQVIHWFDAKASTIDNRFHAVAIVTVGVRDVNDNAPSFSKPVYETVIRKPVTAGRIVINVHASDRDIGINSAIRYSLIPGSDKTENFDIVSTSGEIYVSQYNTINQDAARNYSLIVQAIDGGSVQLSAQVLVKIKVEEEVIPVG